MDKTIEKKLTAFFSQYKYQKCGKGEILIRAEASPPGIYYITKGTVKQYSISPAGEEQLITIYKPPSFFPMMWAINNTANNYFFEAMNEVQVYIAPKYDTVVFIKSEPAVLFDLVGRLYRGITGLLSRIEYLMSGSAYHKVIFTILNSSYRFGEKNPKTNGIILRITHREIAASTGLTKETISRECTKLKNKGLIHNESYGVIVTNTQQLEKELLGA